jgi:ribonuclease HII
MLLVGIDEVGYGCRLGPFIATAVVLETPNPDLWKLLHPEVCRTAKEDGIPVCDSKKLFSQSKGIKSLERTALSFLIQGTTLQGLCKTLGSSACAPWTDGVDLDLPCDSTRDEIEDARRSLKKAFDREGVKFLGAYTRILEAVDFNAGLDRLKNKHDLHVETVLRLLKEVLERHDSLHASVEVGKLSARTFYLRPLTMQFNTSTFIRRETHKLSSYVMDLNGREIELSFVLDGDLTRFSIALASVIGKYVRECWMKLFNQYWARHFEKLKPTAGYGADAVRFWEKIKPLVSSLQLKTHQVYRNR